MTNLTPATEPDIAQSTEQLARASADEGRERTSSWRLMLPTMTPWLAVGIVLVLGIALFGIIGPSLVGDPSTIRDIGLTGPSGDHLLGTTQTGQDVLAQLAWATRGSLQIGLLVGVLATILS
ncbi:MAG TPA: hypothetical protein VGC37_00205, partial [Friedmanniella sp.]